MIYNHNMIWEIEFYEKEDKECPALEYMQSLSPKHRARMEREIDLLEEFGIDLHYPHTRDIKGERYKGLWELRVRFSTNYFRIMYFLYQDGKFIMLNGFTKKGEDPPPGELDRAKRYMEDYISRHRKER